jgi:ABC-type transporter Mla MlaB component
MQTAFTLPTELTIYTVGELRTQWLTWLSKADQATEEDASDPCRIDGAAVHDVDAAGVQLLLSLSRALGQSQRALQIVNASQPLDAACGALGVAALLAMPVAEGASS